MPQGASETPAIVFQIPVARFLRRGRGCGSKVSITPRRLGERRRGDRAANVTDCRSVSRGFDSLPRHPRLRSPAVNSQSASERRRHVGTQIRFRRYGLLVDPRTFL